MGTLLCRNTHIRKYHDKYIKINIMSSPPHPLTLPADQRKRSLTVSRLCLPTPEPDPRPGNLVFGSPSSLGSGCPRSRVEMRGPGQSLFSSSFRILQFQSQGKETFWRNFWQVVKQSQIMRRGCPAAETSPISARACPRGARTHARTCTGAGKV